VELTSAIMLIGSISCLIAIGLLMLLRSEIKSVEFYDEQEKEKEVVTSNAIEMAQTNTQGEVGSDNIIN
jgi:hypothetical protein